MVSPEIANYTPDKKGVAEMVDLTAESKDSEVTVTYKANMVESTETKEVQQTIHYLYEDGTEAAPDKVGIQSLSPEQSPPMKPQRKQRMVSGKPKTMTQPLMR